MGKNPCIPFYASDFYIDTVQMDERLIGAYTKLLCVLWVNEFCHYDAIALARVSPSTKEAVDLIKDKFIFRDDGTFVSKKMEEVRAKQLKISQLRAEAGTKGADGKWHGKSHDKKMTKEYEIEYEIDKVLVDEIYKMYPSKSSKRDHVAKSLKDKEKIAKILKTEYPLKKAVEFIRTLEYPKDLKTFLNNLPDPDTLTINTKPKICEG